MTDPDPDWMAVETPDMGALTLTDKPVPNPAIGIRILRQVKDARPEDKTVSRASEGLLRSRAYMQFYGLQDTQPRLYAILMARENEPELSVGPVVSDAFAANPTGPCKDCTFFMSRDGVRHEFAFSLTDKPRDIIRKYSALSAKFPRFGTTKPVVVSGRRVKQGP
jgi:hypothetical protein